MNPRGFRLPVFKTGAFGRSATPPLRCGHPDCHRARTRFHIKLYGNPSGLRPPAPDDLPILSEYLLHPDCHRARTHFNIKLYRPG